MELKATSTAVEFVATAQGRDRAGEEELKPSITPLAKYRSFYIDDRTGCAFRIRDVQPCRENQVPIANNDQIVWRIDRAGLDPDDLVEVFNAIEGQDEFIVDVYPSVARLAPMQGIVTYRDGIPEGMPPRAPKAFVDYIEGEYQKALASDDSAERARPLIRRAVEATPRDIADREFLFDPSDLIVDGAANLEAFTKALKGARERVIVHSGFVTENVNEVMPNLLSAAGRNVRIDLFCGQDEAGGTRRSSEDAIADIKTRIAGTGLRDRFHIHPFSTESHSKFVVADDRTHGWIGLLGSCNWLASGYKSFDASLRIRDPRFVAQIVGALSQMVKGRPGVWTDTSIHFAVLGREIARHSVKQGRKAEMSLLYTKDHANFVMRAAEEGKKRIFVLSHQFGVAGGPVTVFPLLDRAKDKKIDVSLFYGKPAGAKKASDLLALRERYGEVGMTIKAIERPRLHAKVLGWDDDNLVISSFNWLSVDPSEHKPNRELGVYVRSNSIALKFLRDFEVAQW
ncbi:phospholipase D-like domain-containing protein [Mesorhizobium sp. M1182]|uniref:phospholipase D-like domain-containing protein n=1 Tax=unclassified Mesorhizobium TaxID=325217 RepID=UPI0033350D6E